MRRAPMTLLQKISVAGLLPLLAFSGCATTPALTPAPATPAVAREPVNLTTAKAAVAAYVDDGRYAADLTAVATSVTHWLEQRAATPKSGEKLAVVFDLDETLLSNLPHMRALDFGYLPAEWNAWVNRGEAPVIEPVREVYLTARKLGMNVFFISGRHELRDRAGTEKNLLTAGLADYALLMLKPDEDKATTAEFKTAARKRIEAEGYVIVANVGDQESDLSGGFSERTFKLPDPFYLIP